MKSFRVKPMKNLRVLREERGLSQMAIGLEAGVSASSIQQYEAGINYPSVKTMIKLADFFGVSLDFIFDRSPVREILNNEEQILVDKLRHVNDEVIKKAVLDILKQIIVD